MAHGVGETIDGAQRDHESWHIGAGADLAACIIFVDDFEMNSSVVNHQFVRYRARGADAVPAAKVNQMATAALGSVRPRVGLTHRAGLLCRVISFSNKPARFSICR